MFRIRLFYQRKKNLGEEAFIVSKICDNFLNSSKKRIARGVTHLLNRYWVKKKPGELLKEETGQFKYVLGARRGRGYHLSRSTWRAKGDEWRSTRQWKAKQNGLSLY